MLGSGHQFQYHSEHWCSSLLWQICMLKIIKFNAIQLCIFINICYLFKLIWMFLICGSYLAYLYRFYLPPHMAHCKEYNFHCTTWIHQDSHHCKALILVGKYCFHMFCNTARNPPPQYTLHCTELCLHSMKHRKALFSWYIPQNIDSIP